MYTPKKRKKFTWNSGFIFGKEQQENIRNRKITGEMFPSESLHEDSIIFDCTVCGDPTMGSYDGALASNTCWECNKKNLSEYGDWLDLVEYRNTKGV